MEYSNKILIKNDLKEISRLGEFSEEFCMLNNFPDRIKNHITLVLEEIVTNTIKYGYKGNEIHEIEISLRTSDKYLNVRIEDDASEFDPAGFSKEPDIGKSLDERKAGGLGLFIVKNITDEIKYRRASDRNILELKIKVS